MPKFTVRDLIHLFYNDNLDAVVTAKDILVIFNSLINLNKRDFDIIMKPFGTNDEGTHISFSEIGIGHVIFQFETVTGNLIKYWLDYD